MNNFKSWAILILLFNTVKVFTTQDMIPQGEIVNQVVRCDGNVLLRLLQYLNFMSAEIGLQSTFTTENCAIFDSSSAMSSWCNRVSNIAVPTVEEIEHIKSFFFARPFTWYVDATDTQTRQQLEACKLFYIGSFPAMVRTLGSIQQQEYGANIVVKAIDAHTTDELPLCRDILMRSFSSDASEFPEIINLCIRYITPGAMTFYIGYYQGKPAAVGMTLQHNTTATLQWIGTLPEYRRKGIGYAIAHKALITMQEAGCAQIFLCTSESGKSLYERMGFEEYASYSMYGNCV